MPKAKAGRPKGGRDTPVNSERVMKIVYMRDELGLYFRAIAEQLSEEYPISGQGVFAIYKRWRPWAIREARAAARAESRAAAARVAARKEYAKPTEKKKARRAAV